ncbi:TIGR02996 domain-containing protein [Urbifossiella limnaea]|uniref:SMI1/KNR4 family protein n=1 Tax=Urbifossiella limnaea TaxID=2528023 RepID=A0A517Y034_9BACT|nr:TIGR02996 domain-containing protein [Urbifossiella limnaea]QDU23058.1 hypothetical protein ETAA1_50480 [Urbifossiella limnaea]
MTDEPALLAAIADRPADDTPRLVYADWLDDHGDSDRAEFIRLNVEIDRTAVLAWRYGELRTRLRALRPRIDAPWANRLGYQPRHRPLFAALPESRADRWRLIEDFIEVWHRPLADADGHPEAELRAAEERLGFKLPAALREWHALSGRRHDVWSLQDRLNFPSRTVVTAGGEFLVVRTENQSCETWGVLLDDIRADDPPVWELEAGVMASPTVSAFACVALLMEAIWCGTASAYGEVPEDVMWRLEHSGLSRADLPERYWVGSPVRFYEGTDLIVGTHDGSWVYAAARSQKALQQLDPEILRWLEVQP